jgi:acetylornithine deacetylase/succinyl-diaminopimelate desuccinylase-like protein
MSENLKELFDYLRFPSISTDPAYDRDLRACAEWIANKFRACGLDTEIVQTPGHPVAIGRNRHRPGRPTIMIYGHYDVQPADPLDLWDHPPFEPQLSEGIITARGATDNKGQHFAHFLGVRNTLERNGDLPVNLIFLVEGEEEIGSQSLGLLLEQRREKLACDAIVISDTGMAAPGLPTFTYGLRGIAAMEVRLTGPDKDLHSGIFGGAVANPLTVMARLMATLHDQGFRVAIEGFHDGILPIEPWEREAWRRLPSGEKELLELTGVPALQPESGFTADESIMARPTAELNGLFGGYQGPGSKTVLPSKATAKLTFRLVPGQEPERILRLAEAHMRKHCPPSVRMEIDLGHSASPYLMDPHSPFGQAAQRALRKSFGGIEPLLIREGGSVPIVAEFKRQLGADALLLGLALPDCRIHSPNENFHVEVFEAGIRLNQALLDELGGIS